MHVFGIHLSDLRAVGLSEAAAGGLLFVCDPLMGPAIGVVLTLSRWIRQVARQQTEEPTRQSGKALAASIKCQTWLPGSCLSDQIHDRPFEPL